ncbi:hypothetical protein PI125_g24963 [Phytophthora idaei]|nr:hypothetical protein PI125_g24963 [Phytophthora idaei]
MENRIAGVEQKVSRDLAAVEHAIDQQIHQVTAEREEKMSFAVQKHQQTEHEKGNDLLTSRVDEAIEAAIQKLIPRIQLAAKTEQRHHHCEDYLY